MPTFSDIRGETRTPSLQAAIGLALALVVTGSWLSLHFYALFVFELTWASAPIAVIIAAVLCWLSVGVFIVSHDAMHGSLAPGWPKLNGAIGATLLFLYAGFGWRKMRDAHFEHHKHVGTRGDPDFDADNPRDFARWYTTFFRRYFGWQSVAFVSTVVTTYWLVLDVPMVQLTFLYGAPAIASSLQLFYFGTFRTHRHDDAGFPDHHNARSENFGTLTSLMTCFHFGYHHEHHLAPNVPWWGLPAWRRSAKAAKVAA